MRFILPRVMSGNRGDLASRWGLLRALYSLGAEDVVVFSRLPEDVPPLPYLRYPYGRARNLILDRAGRETLRRADTVLWSVGLDMQDDSSLAKLAYLWLMFRLYRRQGLKIWCLFQGAGPLTTRLGRWLASGVLSAVDIFVARDPGTERLVGGLSTNPCVLLGHDAIFLPGFEQDLQTPVAGRDPSGWRKKPAGPLIGLNVRQWFHFTASLLPYELARRGYLERSREKMKELTSAMTRVVQQLRQRVDARVILLSAYQPGSVPWEDDLPWLAQIKRDFAADEQVILLDAPISMPDYYRLMGQLDIMIGMRLHSSLVALRFGTPALNISYTLKGGDIYRHLGLAENIIQLPQAIETPGLVADMAVGMLADLPAQRERVGRQVTQAIEMNRTLLSGLLASGRCDAGGGRTAGGERTAGGLGGQRG